ncbi:hypothetical protein BN946_scf184361.g3 [Trametes cinnabarina]|uniref:J domain-containing protein n=1 Tax=Pycnoporus cinnabarinus TaxID=5643 RepID=A0A060SWA3_PYCCI|nr:hypothetical protein BN946_scf184361.g3 [Trametes cinnabarina]
MPAKNIPITVFTGFLGAGKTSIILSLLPRLPKDYKVVLLKNEFGDVEVDSKLARQSSLAAVSEILNGCMCCVLVGQMKTALLEIRVIARPVPPFPATLAFQIRELERETADDLKLDAIVTVVDAENFAGYEDTSPTAKMQASYTDVILIRHTINVGHIALQQELPHALPFDRSQLPQRPPSVIVQQDEGYDTGPAPPPPPPSRSKAVINEILAQNDCYAVLGISRSSRIDKSTLRRAYLARSKACHPDKFPDNPEATRAFQKVSVAYDILSEPSSKRVYDARSQHASFDFFASRSFPQAEETFRSVVIGVFNDLLDGDLEMVRTLLCAVNSMNPSLQLGEEGINSVLMTLQAIRTRALTPTPAARSVRLVRSSPRSRILSTSPAFPPPPFPRRLTARFSVLHGARFPARI